MVGEGRGGKRKAAGIKKGRVSEGREWPEGGCNWIKEKESERKHLRLRCKVKPNELGRGANQTIKPGSVNSHRFTRTHAFISGNSGTRSCLKQDCKVKQPRYISFPSAAHVDGNRVEGGVGRRAENKLPAFFHKQLGATRVESVDASRRSFVLKSTNPLRWPQQCCYVSDTNRVSQRQWADTTERAGVPATPTLTSLLCRVGCEMMSAAVASARLPTALFHRGCSHYSHPVMEPHQSLFGDHQGWRLGRSGRAAPRGRNNSASGCPCAPWVVAWRVKSCSLETVQCHAGCLTRRRGADQRARSSAG